MSSPHASVRTVVAALASNVLVTIMKFIAFGVSGSGAMLSEAIHSLADTGNQVLLFVGLRRGTRKSDEDFQYGYGGERFIFGILSAAGIFFIGCGVTVWHGIQTLIHPRLLDVGIETYVVLAVSILIEGSVLVYAMRTVNEARGATSFARYLRERADPATIAVLLEDTIAVLGLVVAIASIVATRMTGSPRWDSIGSITIGLLLGFVAVYLVAENREILLGKAVPDEVEATFRAVLDRAESVASYHDVKTRQITPEEYHLKAEICLDASSLARKLDALIPPDHVGLRAPSGPEREALLVELALGALYIVSDVIDLLEADVRREIPEARYIDLEVDHTATGGLRPSAFKVPRLKK